MSEQDERRRTREPFGRFCAQSVLPCQPLLSARWKPLRFPVVFNCCFIANRSESESVKAAFDGRQKDPDQFRLEKRISTKQERLAVPKEFIIIVSSFSQLSEKCWENEKLSNRRLANPVFAAARNAKSVKMKVTRAER
jgi:hypothetical protein